MESLPPGSRAEASPIRHRFEASRIVSEDLRRHNRSLVLEQLLVQRSLSRTALASQTGLTRPAISRIVDELIAAGLLREQELSRERVVRGRPQIGVELHPQGAYVIGVGIGAFEQWVRIVDARGQCLERRTLKLLRSPSAEQSLEQIAVEARTLIRNARAPAKRVVGAVVAVAGVVDNLKGDVLESPNIGWRNVQVASLLSERLRIPIHVDALHHVLNLVEARAEPDPSPRDAVLVNIALGIGASVMEHGRILRGRHGTAGQIGHMHVSGATEMCTCGRRGCLDTVASGFAVLRRLGTAPARRLPQEHRPSDARRLMEAMHLEGKGDAKVRAAFRASGEELGEALHAVRALIDPERISLAGPLAGAASFVDGVRARLLKNFDGHSGTSVPELGRCTYASDEAAALLALRRFLCTSRLDLARLAS